MNILILIKNLTNKYKDQAFYLFGFILILFFVYLYMNKSFKIKNLESENSILSYRVEDALFDSFLQNKFIGQPVLIDSLVFINETTIDPRITDFKIVVIPDIASCATCYRTTLKYYLKFITEKKIFNRVKLNVIFPSANIDYAKESMGEFINNNICVFVDTTLKYSEKLGIPLTKAAVLLLNEYNNCIYGYSIDTEYPNKDILKSEIINRLIDI